MAHLMQSNDIQNGVEMAWHKLTKIKTSEEMEAEGFPFDYVKRDLLIALPEGTVPLKDWYSICGTDDNKAIGIPQSTSFNFLTNEGFMKIVRETLKGTGAKIVSLGTFSGRAKRYVSIKCGSEFEQFKVGNRHFRNLLNLQDAVDGTMKLLGVGSNTCIVCGNTFKISLDESLKDGAFRAWLRHTKNHALPEKIENFQELLDSYHNASALFKKLLEHGEGTKVSAKTADLVFRGFTSLTGSQIDLDNVKPFSKQRETTVTRLNELFVRGAGNNGETANDLFSAITDFYSHENTQKSRGSMWQHESSEIGLGAKEKERFAQLITTRRVVPSKNGERINTWTFDSQKIEKLATLGEKTMSLTAN